MLQDNETVFMIVEEYNETDIAYDDIGEILYELEECLKLVQGGTYNL